MSRKPQPTDLTQRVMRFFQDNPGEFLTRQDACTKFNCSPRQFSRAAESLKARNALMTDYVYFLSHESLRA